MAWTELDPLSPNLGPVWSAISERTTTLKLRPSIPPRTRDQSMALPARKMTGAVLIAPE